MINFRAIEDRSNFDFLHDSITVYKTAAVSAPLIVFEPLKFFRPSTAWRVA
jgi:hypothetical protein